MNQYKVGVVGVGRVGLPLALSLIKNGISAIGFDINKDLISSINKKKIPFHEEGYDDLIKEIDFSVTSDFSKIKEVDNIIITVGTPLLANIETDLSQIKIVLNSIIKFLNPKHNIILRSTVAPNTTEFVKRYIESNTEFKVGDDVYLSFCPERIAEGKALVELEKLPQIIGSRDSLSAKLAENIFTHISPKIFHTDYISAELVKLFNNTYRYINFSISNQFAMIADDFGANIHEILEMTNTDYPRGKIPSPGLTAGTCLRKDFGMINETNSHSDLLLNSWKVNEFIPKFLVQRTLKETTIFGKNIGILGYTFKMDTDDTRDSLVPKIIRYIDREVPKNIYIHEPNIKGKLDKKFENNSIELILEKCDIIFLALNHSVFKQNIIDIIKNSKNKCVFNDFWNISGTNKIIFSKQDYEQIK
ncbi:MAG: hypothetical protein CL827_02670 [Crocinitomicaceae bacterium]|nr:hypothetical protein [Crocinitomicaceae bacterium]|tara:strand:- start:2192 stop:3445 length:1254 start_codon:yes stop_codon:yes gene_type:complete